MHKKKIINFHIYDNRSAKSNSRQKAVICSEKVWWGEEIKENKIKDLHSNISSQRGDIVMAEFTYSIQVNQGVKYSAIVFNAFYGTPLKK